MTQLQGSHHHGTPNEIARELESVTENKKMESLVKDLQEKHNEHKQSEESATYWKNRYEQILHQLEHERHRHNQRLHEMQLKIDDQIKHRPEYAPRSRSRAPSHANSRAAFRDILRCPR